MRSLIIIEVEHGEDTDALAAYAERITNPLDTDLGDINVNDYNVRVDVGDTYVVRSWDNPTTGA